MLTRLSAWFARQSARRGGLLAVGLGMLSALAFPPLHLLPVLLLAIPGLLRLIRTAPDMRTAMRRGWCFGVGMHVAGLYWLTEAILVEAARYWWLVPLAVPMLAAFLALFLVLPAALTRLARSDGAAILILAGSWTLADLLRQFILSGFPWNLWGSIWAIPGVAGDVLLQPAALVGVHGLGLTTLLLASLPCLGRRAWPIAVAAALAWGGIAAWRLHLPTPEAPGPMVILVQGNVAQGQKWDRGRALDIFRHYLALTAQGVAQAGTRTAVVVWPETASPFPLQLDRDARTAIAEAAGGNPVLAGSVRWDDARRPRNSLIPVLAGGAIGEIYDKWHLVPFGEVQPDWFPLPIQIVPGGGFAAGPGPRTIRLDGLPPFGPLICYEAIFGGEIVDRADRPAWLVNVTNDAWFGESAGPYQHLAAARMRAVEEGLPIARAANTGISALYDGFGHERGRLGLGEAGVLVLPLPGVLPPPPFTQGGLAIALTLAVVCMVAGGLASSQRQRLKNGIF
jgi:apolipoprotein N-acyltransferase